MGQAESQKSASQRGEAGGGRSSRCVALIGPYLSGKTTLLEAILARTGAIARSGNIRDKSTVGILRPKPAIMA